jgi:hypothetical protein
MPPPSPFAAVALAAVRSTAAAQQSASSDTFAPSLAVSASSVTSFLHVVSTVQGIASSSHKGLQLWLRLLLD